MNINRINKLNELLTKDLKRKPTIILEPNQEHLYRFYGIANDIVLGIDADEWEIPSELEQFVTDVAKADISNEEKILKIYQKLCEVYVYDDNVLSYIKKNDDGTFFLPDEYGRKTDSTWRENRKKHNRRNCFEISRILAKAITKTIKISGYSGDYDICIIWDEANTHYFVGVACNEYYVSLDLDDFTQIKDITRMKTDLTLDGIKILEDNSGKFEKIMKKVNENRSQIAKDHIQEKRKKIHQINGEKNISNDNIDLDDIEFLKCAVQILKEEYNLDPAGIYEYLKEIVDMKIGARFRKKVWKKVEDNGSTEKGAIYTRCLIVTIDDVSYMIDVTKENPSEIIQCFDEKELEGPNPKFILFKEMNRDWSKDPYDGR